MKKKSDLLTIGELSRMSGVSLRILHLHEERGLISSVRSGKLGNRYFENSTLAALQKIKQLQAIGLSLDEIARVLPLYMQSPGGVSGKKAALAILHEHLKETDEKIAELKTFRNQIKRSIAHVEKMLAELKGIQ